MGFFDVITEPLGDIIGGITGATGIEDASRAAAASSDEAAQRAEALNRERYGQAQGYMAPWIGRSDIASQQLMAELGLPQYSSQQGQQAGPLEGVQDPNMGPSPNADPSQANITQFGGFGRGTGGMINRMMPKLMDKIKSADESGAPSSPYMNPEGAYEVAPEHVYRPRDTSQIPGYQAAMDESLRAAEQSAISSGSTAYGGRRLEAAGEVGAGVQQSYYNNYMNMLQNMASPQSATNMASMGLNQGVSMGQQNLAATNQSNQYRMEGAGARQAGIGDILGAGAGVLGGAYAGGYI